MAKTTAPKKSKPAKATAPAAASKKIKCTAADVGHRSCKCADCDHNAPKK